MYKLTGKWVLRKSTFGYNIYVEVKAAPEYEEAMPQSFWRKAVEDDINTLDILSVQYNDFLEQL